MISGTVIGSERVIERFREFPARLREELIVGIRNAGSAVLRLTKDRLSDQVLRVRTGRLRRSINLRMYEGDKTITATVGTNVEYAAVHEYGFHGTVSVREHLRTSVLGNSFTVKAHPREVNLPERSFLRSSLRDLEPDIRVEFEQAIQRAMRP